MLPIEKISVDSKYKAEDSISDSNLKLELSDVLTMPENSIFLKQQTSAFPTCGAQFTQMYMISYILV